MTASFQGPDAQQKAAAFRRSPEARAAGTHPTPAAVPVRDSYTPGVQADGSFYSTAGVHYVNSPEGHLVVDEAAERLKRDFRAVAQPVSASVPTGISTGAVTENRARKKFVGGWGGTSNSENWI